MTVLLHPPHSPDLVPCDYFLFARMKKMLAGRKCSCRSSMGSAVFHCLKGISKIYYAKALQIWLKRLKLCIKFDGKYV